MGTEGISNNKEVIVHANTREAARTIAGISGSPDKIEKSDLKTLTVSGGLTSLNFKKVRDEKAITADDFTVWLQGQAEEHGSIRIALPNGSVMEIEPIIPTYYKNEESFASSPIVKGLTSGKAKEVPNKINDHFKNSGYTYERDCKYFSPDNRCIYLPPWIFNGLKKGDCSAFAIFSHYILSKAGYKDGKSLKFLLIYFKQDSATENTAYTHNICAYQDKETGDWNYFDQDGLHLTQAEGITQLIDASIPNWSKAEELRVINGRVIVTDDAHSTFIFPSAQ